MEKLLRPLCFWIQLSLLIAVWINAVNSERENKFVEWEELEKAENEESQTKLRQLLQRYAFETHRRKRYIQPSAFDVENHVRQRKILDFQKGGATQRPPLPDNGRVDVKIVHDKEDTEKVIEDKGTKVDVYSGDSEQIPGRQDEKHHGELKSRDVIAEGSGELTSTVVVKNSSRNLEEIISTGNDASNSSGVNESKYHNVSTAETRETKLAANNTVTGAELSTDNTADESAPFTHSPATHHGPTASSSVVDVILHTSINGNTLLINDEASTHHLHRHRDFSKWYSVTSSSSFSSSPSTRKVNDNTNIQRQKKVISDERNVQDKEGFSTPNEVDEENSFTRNDESMMVTGLTHALADKDKSAMRRNNDKTPFLDTNKEGRKSTANHQNDEKIDSTTKRVVYKEKIGDTSNPYVHISPSVKDPTTHTNIDDIIQSSTTSNHDFDSEKEDKKKYGSSQMAISTNTATQFLNGKQTRFRGQVVTHALSNDKTTTGIQKQHPSSLRSGMFGNTNTISPVNDPQNQKHSTLSFRTEESLEEPISDIDIGGDSTINTTTLAFVPSYDDSVNVAGISTPTIKGIAETYPTIAESLSETVFHFTTELAADTASPIVRVKRTTSNQPKGEAKTTQEFPTTMVVSGWNESCTDDSMCEDGLECADECACPNGSSFSPYKRICMPDEYWTNIEWNFTNNLKNKTLSVEWILTSPDSAKDVENYKVLYWISYQSGAFPKEDDVDIKDSYTFKDLRVGSQQEGRIELTLKTGETLKTTDNSFSLCYDSRLNNIEVNSFSHNRYVRIKYTYRDGCYSNITARIQGSNFSSKTIELNSNFRCMRSPNDFLKDENIDLKSGTSYQVEITQKSVCDKYRDSFLYPVDLNTHPQVPTGLEVVREGTTFLTVSWDPPTEGTVDYYKIRLTDNKRKIHLDYTVQDGEHQYNMTGLQEGTKYNVTVIAIYYSKKSKTSTAATTVNSVPKKPLYLKMEGHLVLRWTKWSRPFDKPEYFIVHYSCSKTGIAEVSTPNTSIALNVRADECCNISVSGVNAKGQGQTSELTKHPTFRARLDPIENLNHSFNHHGDTAILHINLKQSVGNGTVYKLQVTHRRQGGQMVTQEWYCAGLDCIYPCGYAVPPNATPFPPGRKDFHLTFAVLPATAYVVSVKPFIAIESSTKTETTTFKSPDAPPTSPVTDFGLMNKTSENATFSWMSPIESNGIIQKYNISMHYLVQNCSDVINGDNYYIRRHTYRVVPANKSHTYDIDGLLPYTNYNISVVAANAAGQSKCWSDPISFRTDPIPEIAPVRNLSKTVGARYVWISWEPPCPLTEPLTTYVIEIYKNATAIPIITLETSNNTMLIKRLLPVTFYRIRILGKGTRISSEITVETKTDVPGPVDNLTLTQEEELWKDRQLFVNWSAPLSPNGFILGYTVTVRTDQTCPYLKPITVSTMETYQSIPATPECQYFVRVIARTVAGHGVPVEKQIFIKAGVPPSPRETLVHPLVHLGERCKMDDATRTVPLNLPKKFLCDSSFGRISYRGVLVINQDRKDSNTEEPRVILQPSVVSGGAAIHQPDVVPQQLRQRDQAGPHKTRSGPSPNHPGPPSHRPQHHPHDPDHSQQDTGDQPWHIVLLSSSDVSCKSNDTNSNIVSPNDGGCSQVLQKGDLRFVVGKYSKCVNNRCNKFLESGTRYSFQAFVCTSAGCTVSLQSKIIQTEASKSDKSMLVIGVLCGIFVVIIIILAFVLYRNRHLVSQTFRRLRNIPDDATEGVEMGRTVMPSKPIALADFVAHVDRMHQDSNLLFSEEYKLVTQLSFKYSTNVAELPANRCKNRYNNVLPFDRARVKLLPLDDDDEPSDYINASFIPGHRGPREYIAAQGPLGSTIDDFWRMVWEQRANAIVMLTQCKEKGKVKCEEYWPTDSQSPGFHGDLRVTLKSESNLPDYVIRVMDLQLGTTKRTVYQFHFLKWPDFGCPEKTYLLLNLVAAVRDHTPRNPNAPMVIHCSAGVGRSGTYITLDTLLQQIKDGSRTEVDIFGLVMAMRKNRPLMVQRENQYIYIHDCLRDALLDESDEENSLNDNEHVYNNT